jgi:hypothetical protein
MQTCCPVVELRQYTLIPGKRDELIDLFDREFVESQEILGSKIIGQFRDVGDPNRFVWIRGFSDMEWRAIALEAFYSSPIWERHREEANATMVDSDNVLLLRPVRPMSGFRIDGLERKPVGAAAVPASPIVATIFSFDRTAPSDFVDYFEWTVIPACITAQTRILAYFVTESAENNFPALPVRENENVFVCFSTTDLPSIDASRIDRAPEVLTLVPTTRSLVRG